MTARAALLAALIAGAPAGAQGTGTALPGSALPGMTVPTAVPATSVVLLDGQKLTVSVAFAPGSGDAPYPPAVPFSKTSPAYYPASGDARNIHLSVQSALSSAALVLRAHVVTARTARPAARPHRVQRQRRALRAEHGAAGDRAAAHDRRRHLRDRAAPAPRG